MDLLGVWNWRTRYNNKYICDGTQWEARIQYSGKKVNSGGSNRFPMEDGSPSEDAEFTPTFIAFVEAVRELCGMKEKGTYV